MRIKCWGSRGSLAVSGPEFLKYGGDTTCLEIRSKNDALIIVDAGTGIRRLGNLLVAEERSEMDFIFTHAHWDHLMGFPFFKPLFNNAVRVRMQGCPFARQYVEHLISRVMAPPNFPIRPSDIKAEILYEPSCPTAIIIDSITVTPIPINHPNMGSGYRFTEDGKSFVFLTDNELDYHHPGGPAFDEFARFVEGADLLIHDAEFTPEEYEAYTRGWGHSTYTRAVDLALAGKVGSLGLFHLNQDRTDHQQDRIVERAMELLRERGSEMVCCAVARDQEFIL